MTDETRATSLKHDGCCPICHSHQVRSGEAVENKGGLRGANRLPLSATMAVALDNYVCLACGYVESYIADRGVLNRIGREWPRVAPD